MSKNIFNTRFQSKEVMIGSLPLGGNNPVRIQSMTSTNTMDTLSTVEQSIRMIEAGCEYVRITAPGIKEAKHLAVIKKELNRKGYHTPLIADIHYNPKAAEIAAQIVEKVRINPGNYVDRNSKSKSIYSKQDYKLELEKIADNIYPLLKICNQNQTAIRIGSNHGSLSQRITSTYGDTPLGMVESAIEFVKICEQFQFYNLVLSMKSSNIKVMVHAYRLLVDHMIGEGMSYPLHLGVTEAGDGEEGRIKSAIGIGTLLQEGLGDTIRVSLTEDPEFEIPVAKKIIEFSPKISINKIAYSEKNNPFEYNRKKTKLTDGAGGNIAPLIISHGTLYGADLNSDKLKELVLSAKLLALDLDKNSCFDSSAFSSEYNTDYQKPIILQKKYENISFDNLMIQSAIDFGKCFINGVGDGMQIISDLQEEKTINLGFKILQACGVRLSSTEFISCPSCGRTKFNIQKALQQVKKATNHLVGLKIAVMGCVVNGPGEMADAHYGYVGSGKGKVNLYKSRDLVKKNIDENNAVNALIKLIKENGDWKDPEK